MCALPRLNIVGAGKLGKTVGKLLSVGSFRVGGVLNRTRASGLEAVRVLGQGHAVTRASDLPSAAAHMLSTSDGAVAASCDTLVAAGVIRPRDLVFHCSGALDSSVLSSARKAGAFTASMHPLKSFPAGDAQLQASIASFPGTPCALEGDAEALALLRPHLEALGGKVLVLEAHQKALWHAAAVMTCEKVAGVLQSSLDLYEMCGLDRATALAVMTPLATETVRNVCAVGPGAALTGPVQRGDTETIQRHLMAISALVTQTSSASPASPASPASIAQPSHHHQDLSAYTGSAGARAEDIVAAYRVLGRFALTARLQHEGVPAGPEAVQLREVMRLLGDPSGDVDPDSRL